MKLKMFLTSISGRNIYVNPDTIEFVSEGTPPAGAILHFISDRTVSISNTVQETVEILESGDPFDPHS
jgi:uncharacterized protein YlzI (FlbEa/FlbD family)